MLMLKIIYAANILVVGWVSITCLLFPKIAKQKVFGDIFVYSGVIQLAGALYLPIFLLSIVGLYFPLKMSLVLLFQFIYKAAWMFFAALPALLNKRPLPQTMTFVFIIYLVILPWVIPWKYIFS